MNREPPLSPDDPPPHDEQAGAEFEEVLRCAPKQLHKALGELRSEFLNLRIAELDANAEEARAESIIDRREWRDSQ